MERSEARRQVDIELLNYLSPVNLVKEHHCYLAGKIELVKKLLGEVAKSEYVNLPAAWAIPLYMSKGIKGGKYVQ